MKRKNKIILAAVLVLFCSGSFGQAGQYSYKRSLAKTHDQWHRIVLPDGIFGKIAADFSDIRIIGITKGNDTVAAPYILQIATEKITDSSVDFKLINESKTDKGYYFTFELPARQTINQIKLDFSQSNFDWRIKLEASQNQQEWFTVIDDYRILSIKNELTNYQFTTLAFPQASYRYFRVLVNSNLKPGLLAAKISKEEITGGKYKVFTIDEIKTTEDKQYKRTFIDISLPLSVPVSYLKVYVHDKVDYYRHIKILYLADSFKTSDGREYRYKKLTSGTLTSIEKNEFKFNGMILKKVKLDIENQDNAPLKIDSVQVKGFEYSLAARFTDAAAYYLIYGNSEASKPDYDIERFADRIPATAGMLELGAEQSIKRETVSPVTPLFQNKIWLWVTMITIIIILGWFSVKMMRKA